MKSKVLKVVAGTLAMALMLVSVPAETVQANEAQSRVICPHLNKVLMSSEEGVAEWYGGDQHRRLVTETYYCNDCNEWLEEEYYTYEDHFYTYNYSTYEWVCECGDSYTH